MPCTDIPNPNIVTAEATADNTSIIVMWEWSRPGLLMCLTGVNVSYQHEGVFRSMFYTVDNVTATSATLPNLQCNTKYNISVNAEGGSGKRSIPAQALLPGRGIVALILVTYCFFYL